MKSLYILSVIVVLAVICCGLISSHVANTCEEMIADNGAIRQAIHERNFDAAALLLDELHTKWMGMNENWEMFCNHDDLSLVTASIDRARILCDQRNGELLLLECADIELALRNIAHKEVLSVQNII